MGSPPTAHPFFGIVLPQSKVAWERPAIALDHLRGGCLRDALFRGWLLLDALLRLRLLRDVLLRGMLLHDPLLRRRLLRDALLRRRLLRDALLLLPPRLVFTCFSTILVFKDFVTGERGARECVTGVAFEGSDTAMTPCDGKLWELVRDVLLRGRIELHSIQGVATHLLPNHLLGVQIPRNNN